jgi:hypothetical protein
MEVTREGKHTFFRARGNQTASSFTFLGGDQASPARPSGRTSKTIKLIRL